MTELEALMQEWEDHENALNYCRSRAIDVLIRECEQRGISRQRLAELTHYDKGYLRKVFRRETEPTTRFMVQAVLALQGLPTLARVIE